MSRLQAFSASVKSLSPTAFWIADGVGAVAMAAALAWAVDQVAAGQRHMAVTAAVVVVLAAGARFALQWAAAVRGQQAANRVKHLERRRAYSALLRSDPDDQRMVGEAIADVVDRVDDLDGLHGRFAPLRQAAVATPLLVALAAAMGSWVSAVILIATLPVFALGMALAGSAAARAADQQLDALGRLSGLFVDRIRALAVIVSFGAQDRVRRQLSRSTEEVATRTIAVLRMAFISGAVLDFFSAVSVALVAVYCGFSLLGLLPFSPPETLTLGRAMYVLVLAPEFYLPLRRLAGAYHDRQVGEAAARRLGEMQVQDATPSHRLSAPPAICFEGVAVARGERRIGPVSFEAAPGETVAIMGPTGCGKTSLLNALLGISNVSEGSVRIDGEPLRPGGLAGQVSWLGQVVALTPGTMAENIGMACPGADSAAIEKAARAAGLGPLIEARGLQLSLDYRGAGLSGGERRRIGLARAILRDAPLWLLDEPTADLDSASAEAVIGTLRRVLVGRTALVVTHSPRLAALAGRRVLLS